jgi:hypothetical protein
MSLGMGEFGGHAFEEQVRQRAYQLWEQAGRPDAQSDEFWFRALHELQGTSAEDGSSPPSGTIDAVDLESEQSVPASDPPSSTSASAR